MRILLIVNHLSTGGLPQVALKRVETLINNHDIYVIEYREIAYSYVVQRNKINNLLGDKFISLGNVWDNNETKRDKFKEIVENINPDIIHMEEIPEMFGYGGLIKDHVDWLYRKDRPYKIIETTHTSTFNINQKQYFPDQFMFMSKYSQNEYSGFDIPSSVVEYPIEILEKNQGQARNILNLDSDYFHVLNVGLFTKNKNQGYLFDLAKKFQDYKIQFHFVGNLASNFEDYWEPIVNTKPNNCFIYDERADVDIFYQACDLVVHPSLLELNPLVIKEATSYDIPIFLTKLPTYLDMYDSYKNIKYLTMNLDEDIKNILDNFNIKKLNDNKTFFTSLNNEYNKVLKYENNVDYEFINYEINIIDGCKIEITGNSKSKIGVEIFDNNTAELIYKSDLSVNTWCTTNSKYYREYKVNLINNNQIITTNTTDLNNKNVLIQLDSKSIGDTIAWFPYTEEFRKKHNCKLYCSTFWNSWFKNQYPEITFVEPNEIVENVYAKYTIGWYQPIDYNRNPIDYKKIPLQKTSSDILGLDYTEIVPKINIPTGTRPIEEKYVCIGQYSTANAKHWHYPCKNSNKGWQILVDWLNEQGYKVIVISKQKTSLKHIIDHTGNFPIEHRINELKYCEFFIGVGSGLSWLAWAVGKKVVMISGFSNPICEFKQNIINVHNFNVCNGCFNKHDFDRGDWNWCPEHKNTDRQFECSINITPKMITDRIINTKLIDNPKTFDFDKYDFDIILDKNDIDIIYDIDINKFSIEYKNIKDTLPLNIDFIDFTTKKSYHVMSEIILSNKYIVWSIPKDIIHIETNKIIVSFFEKNKILDIIYDIK